MSGTQSSDYAEGLSLPQRTWWKRLLPIQVPYRLNLRRQKLGVCLDVGCGIGRNLSALDDGSLGVDHNPYSVAIARERGLNVMEADDLKGDRSRAKTFDSLLFAHVLEHMSREDARGLVTHYLDYLKPGGKVFVICPQERGFQRDATHVWFATDSEIRRLLTEVGLDVHRSYSFPLPRWAGRAFTYNEFCVLASDPQ